MPTDTDLPSSSARVCKQCGSMFVALTKRAAEKQAMELTRQAVERLREDLQKVAELTREAEIVLDNALGICRLCSAPKRDGWGAV